MLFDTNLLQSAIADAGNRGLHAASIKFLANIGISSISVSGVVPTDGPLLLITNHTSVLDPILLYSRIKREDLHLATLYAYAVFGHSIQGKFLPIYKKRRFRNKLFEYPLCIAANIPIPENLTDTEVKSRNRTSIHKAANIINAGNAVFLFPTGSAGKPVTGGTWKAGVGFLCKELTNPDTQVVFAKITGTKISDIALGLRSPLRNIVFRPNPITLEFSTPMRLKQVVNQSQDGRQITLTLEQKYNATWN